MQEDTEEDAEAPPPPIATRPERTKSIYTKPVDSDEETTPSLKLPPTINENDLYDKSSEKSTNNNHSSTAKTEAPKSGTPREKKKKMHEKIMIHTKKDPDLSVHSIPISGFDQNSCIWI